jgi:SAM-dependent methyltransferase
MKLLNRVQITRVHKLDSREHIGGLWEQMGIFQFEYLVSQGLKPEHRLLDVGCGSLGGGIHFVRYLDDGNYYGLDIEQRLLDAGRTELAQVGLADRNVSLIADNAFRVGKFGEQFPYALAQSVFTHLSLNVIMRCLSEVEKVLLPGGQFYATFFCNPSRRLNVEPFRAAEEITAYADRDPPYYDPDVFRWAVEGPTLSCTVVGEWNHPRNQHMLLFTKAP